MKNIYKIWIFIALAVHTTGAIRPATTKDSQQKCGSVLCKKVSEIYSQTKLNHGYNYITTIPAGAMNVTIKQLIKTINLIALKTTDDIYIINGNNKASEGGIFLYDDDAYEYNKEASLISAKGPLHKPVKLMLMARTLNPGVSYVYTLPVASASITEPEELQSQWNELGLPLDEMDENAIRGLSGAQISRFREKKRRRFSWELLGFGPCNRTCGSGVQLPIFRCIRESPTKESLSRYYSPKRCAFIEKPEFSKDIYHCNRGLCPAYWRPMDYGDCECTDSATEGVRSRQLQCVQEQVNGLLEEVDESNCKMEKLPDLKETCNCKIMAKRKMYARNSDNPANMYSKLIGSPGAIRTVSGKRHTNTSIAPPLRRFHRDNRFDKAGVWLMSDWSQRCSEGCLAKQDYRTIYCDRTAPYTDLCDARLTPEQKRSCSQANTCRKGSWFTSDWSNCTGECFQMKRTRTVLCIKDGFVIDDAQCSFDVKPVEAENCTKPDVQFCGPKWHYSEWSECSRTCGEGVQRRYAKCLEFDWKQKAMVESNNCKYAEREPVYGACTVAKCEEIKYPQHDVSAAKAATASAAAANDIEQQWQNDDGHNYDATEKDAVADIVGIRGTSKHFTNRDLAAGKEKLVIAAAPRSLKNCNDELNNCKRINRERLCKMEFYQIYCCLTCHGYF